MKSFIKRGAALLIVVIQGVLCWADQSERYAIVFDVGNVLIHEPKYNAFKAALREVGVMKSLLHIPSLISLEQKYYDVLNNVGLKVHLPVPTYSRGKKGPHAIGVRMTDHMTGQEIIDEAGDLIRMWIAEDNCRPCPYHENLPKHFESAYQAELVQSLIRTTIDPQKFVSLISPYHEGLSLLKRCAAEKNQYGAPRHELFLLSNFDTPSWNLLMENAVVKEGVSPVADTCEICCEAGSCGTHRLISGMFRSENHIKPNPVFYHVLLHQCAQHGIQPDHVIFCDDNLQNIEAARQLGIRAYHVTDVKSFDAIAREWEQEEILTQPIDSSSASKKLML